LHSTLTDGEQVETSAGKTREYPRAQSTKKQLGAGARIPIMARHQRMPTLKAEYT